jgi:hypothetical protein
VVSRPEAGAALPYLPGKGTPARLRRYLAQRSFDPPIK